MTESQAQQLLPDGVYATFNYSCNVCGGTVSVQNSMRQPHTCGGDGVPALDLPAIRALHAEQSKGEWAALTDPGDWKTAPAWIVDAGDIEVRLPATYEAGRLAAFIAAAPSIVEHLLAVIDAGLEACEMILDNRDGHKAPGPPHPSREQVAALRIQRAIRAAIAGDGQ